MSHTYRVEVSVLVEIHDDDAYGNVQALRDTLVSVAELSECSFDHISVGSSINPEVE